MLKKIVALCLFVYTLASHAQSYDPTFLYNQGVATFNKGQFSRADSFYTASLRMQEHKDTYFNRAAARLKLNNKKGYIEDLGYASSLGDKEAGALLQKEFEKSDTLRVSTKIVLKDSNIVSFFYVTYSNANTKEVFETKFDQQNRMLSAIWYTPVATIDTIGEETAEFPGGLRAMMIFIRDNVNYPAAARERGIEGKAFLKFVITQTGIIERVELLKGVNGCPECDREAARVVAAMPRWKPARLNGGAVKMYFNLPFSFKIQ